MAHGSLGYYVIFCVYEIECRVWVCYCVDELWGGARVLSLVHSWLVGMRFGQTRDPTGTDYCTGAPESLMWPKPTPRPPVSVGLN